MEKKLRTILMAIAMTGGILVALLVGINNVGEPFLTLLAAMFISWNSWNCCSGKTMFTGQGVMEGDVDNYGRYGMLFLIWVLFVGLLIENILLLFP